MRISVFIFLVCSVFFSNKIKAQSSNWVDANLRPTTKLKGVYSKMVTKKGNKEIVVYSFKNDKPYRKYQYKEGKKDGSFYEFYRSGELKVDGKYNKGLKDGVWKVYYKAGKIKEKGKYNKGEKVGIWKLFYKNI